MIKRYNGEKGDLVEDKLFQELIAAREKLDQVLAGRTKEFDRLKAEERVKKASEEFMAALGKFNKHQKKTLEPDEPD